ncbi:DUF397 domain-containing protein [Streptomyces sp. NBC_01481]|uniref:DUF397 domain-containing protein n=1 Tax=Streptomyces sp. NBC_01481 TaxID=2975869 RepID=UPI00225982E2|nr:DUF397 domain-containing protein [Streptomyces sp. NBC_01481]MCX4586786.1 DUF397 domain-containing protein [Streptomyces sp. NBC_01481]
MNHSEHVIPDAAVPSLWRKSSYSGASEGSCLEVNDAHPTHIPVRDSKNPHGPAVVFGPAAWTSFVTAVKAAGAVS